MAETPSTLSEVLAPVSTHDFRGRILGQNYFVGKGQPGKFSGLFPWKDLNDVLRRHRLDVPRLRLIKEGAAVSADSFITYQSSRRKPSLKVPRLRSADLTKHLRDGATLIIDAVDELQEPITALAEDFERQFRARIQVNCYAGWRTSRGFDLHWDDHDVIVLQVAGRKEWKVYPMTREYPLAGDPLRDAPPPQEPLWEGLLEDGDFLYIPRGWWHVAVPLDEPTLHLTFGLHHLNGTDFLAWFMERLRDSITIRQDLPRLSGPAEQNVHLNKLKEAWEQAWTPGLIGEYLAGVDRRAKARPRFSLPWSALPSVLPPDDDWSVRWTAPRPVCIIDAGEADSVEFSCEGKTWTFARSAAPLLARLQLKGVCSASELVTFCQPNLDSEAVRELLKGLVVAGLAAVENDSGH